MGAKRSTQKSGLPEEYYVPDYKIEIEGRELDAKTKGDVIELKVKMDLDNLTSIDLTVNNWDDRESTVTSTGAFGFKYSDTDTFDTGNRIHVQMGYVDDQCSMAKGVITTLTPKFPETGPPTLGVSALDSLVKLRDRKPKENDEKKFENKSDSDIAKVIASRNNLKFKSDSSGRQDPVVAQGDLDEARFLKFLAARNDFDCFIGVDPDSGDETLYFKKPTDGREGGRIREYVFEWGKSLINFTPTLSISEQVSSVTVRGWNPRTKEAIVYTATKDDLPQGGDGKNGPKAVEAAFGAKGDVIVNHPVVTGQEAQDLAISLLRERANKFIKGSGQVIGLPDLRPGDNVQLCGLGKRFSGRYYVTKVEHSLGSTGYLTQFEGELRMSSSNPCPKPV